MENSAAGFASAIPGGARNAAEGDYSVVTGFRAKNNLSSHNGVFMFADSSDFDFYSVSKDEFAVRATGGVRFVTGINASGAPTWSCVTSNGSGWSCSSDRTLKQDLAKLDGRRVLSRLLAMPVFQWSPRGDNAHIRHFGPMAQDFRAAFGLGDSDKHVGMQDADGVALAAIQGLHDELKDRDTEIASQRKQIARQSQMLDALAKRLKALERRLGG